ncbi:hypothetical protein DV515_00012892 [Chloebia gouldiae]|uniref:Uncharacterized protein n=1 Tax=Chloebia gouldiae TaxID=44316 RepID=A0A3L8S2I9_CHLGU|nr:hypothetical protein DV515_00012892 [Chloebia gouldiae]
MDTSVVPQMSNAMSQLIGLKEKGLPRIARLLQSNSSEVVRSGASLLSNMSRHPVLHKTMAHQVLPDVSRLLSFQSGNTSSYGEIMTSACYTLRNLIMSNPHLGKSYLSSNLLNNVVSLCRNGSCPKAAEAARLLLTDLWSNRELQSVLKQNLELVHVQEEQHFMIPEDVKDSQCRAHTQDKDRAGLWHRDGEFLKRKKECGQQEQEQLDTQPSPWTLEKGVT